MMLYNRSTSVTLSNSIVFISNAKLSIMATLPFTIVNAFCDPEKKFSGNPAAVCLLESDDDIPDETKACIGAQFNLSETAFVSKSWCKSRSQQSAAHFTIRWFTPTNEIALCGHATLASAKVLFNKMEKGCDSGTTVYFETKHKGNLSATMNWNTGRISINLPLTPVTPLTETEMKNLPQFLQHLSQSFDTTCIHSIHYTPVTKYLFVRLNDKCGENLLSDLKPDFFAWSTIQGNNSVIGIIVTVKGIGDVHFYSRFFAPWAGVNEDPACGSAHCALAPYWSEVYNLNNLLGKQCSSRSGYIYCSINDSTPERVTLEGDTKVFGHGELLL